MFAAIKIITPILILVASALLLIWIFRPGSKIKYEKLSKIALKDDKILRSEERRKGGKK